MTLSVVAVIVLLVGLTVSRVHAIYWQISWCLLGTTAAIILPGGATILPAVLFMPFLAIRAWPERYGPPYSQQIPRAGIWLALLVIWGVAGAIFLPRFFAGQTEIVGIDRSSSTGLVIGPLGPVSGNLTQGGYAVGGLIAFLSFHKLLRVPGRMVHFRDAVLLLTALDCAAAVLNIAEFRLHLPSMLDYVRTAYSQFGDYEIEGTGMMRIHGTFSETAGFSGFSLPLFAYSFSLWLHKVRPWYTGLLSAMLIVFLLISTSTTAYVGLAMYGLMLGFVLTYRGYVRGVVPRISVLVAGGLLAIVVVGSTFVLETDIARGLQGYFDRTVFNKMDSASGIERGYWNRQAWTNFLDSYGIGVGVGSVRCSSYAMVLLSNVGVVGTTLFLIFLRRILSMGRRRSMAIEPISEASRQAILASLAAALPSATVFDLGIIFYAHAAAACTVAPEFVRRAWSAPQGGDAERTHRHHADAASYL